MSFSTKEKDENIYLLLLINLMDFLTLVPYTQLIVLCEMKSCWKDSLNSSAKRLCLPTSFSSQPAVCRSRATADSNFLIFPVEYWHLFLKTVELFLPQLHSVFWQQVASVQCHPGVPISQQKDKTKMKSPSPLVWN